MKNNSLFSKRKVLIATKHQKEKVIGPILHREWEMEYFTSDAFDTDTLGTFSGEIERKLDALSTLRQKCIKASEASGCDLVVASEGSFGPHPTMFFAHADEELIMLLDRKNDLEIVSREITLETNFNGTYLNNKQELREFCNKVGFPEHGIILKSSEGKAVVNYKDIDTFAAVERFFEALQNDFQRVYIETDMRAHRNPTRMRVIEKTALKLVEKMKHECPECGTPGLDVVRAIPGLPCSNCGLPTKSVLKLEYQCKRCQYVAYTKFPRGIEEEDPTYCDYCNP